MVRNIFLLVALYCLMICAQSCVHGDLDDCPPMVNYAVAFTYTHHALNNDRFYDDTKKINLFVFDNDNLIYTYVTDVGPHEPSENFNISLDLPMGNYHILAWGNVLDDQPFTFTPEVNQFVKGQTTLSEARLSLNREAGNLSHQQMEKLLFGDLDIGIPMYVSRIDTIPLINDTKNIRVVIHWDHSGEIRATQGVIDYDEVHLHLDASNAVYNFNNLFTGLNNVVYEPFDSAYDRTYLDRNVRDFEQRIYHHPRETPEEFTNSCVYDFTILRMMTNSPVMLSVERHKKALTAPVVLLEIDIVQEFIDLFSSRGVTVADRQSEFDRYDNYRLDLYFTYDEIAGEYVTGKFNILDWHFVDQPVTPGN